jgi:hypothetical protein
MQKRVAPCDHEYERDHRGRQADRKAFAHVKSLRFYTA